MQGMRRWGLVLVVTLSAALACGGCSGPAEATGTPTPTKTTPTTDDVRASVNVEADIAGNMRGDYHEIGGPCAVPAGYDDMVDGGAVAVLDASGKTIALGELVAKGMFQSLTNPDSTSLLTVHCGFEARIDDVPTGGDFYSIVVGHRDPIRETEADLFSYMGVQLTLGNVP